MAIQMRRGAYGDLNPSKAVAAEVLVVTSNDPSVADGKSVYVAFSAGSIKRLVTAEEFADFLVDAADAATEAAEAVFAENTITISDHGLIIGGSST